MKQFILALVVLAVASVVVDAIGYHCYDAKPKYCARKKKWCTVFKNLRAKCRKTCGFCGPATLPPGTTNPPYSGKCGVPEVKGVRIIAGTTPPRGAWPWQLLLSWKGYSTCGATLIAPQWAVCASHCVDGLEKKPTLFSLRAGEHDRKIKEGSEEEVTVEKIIMHQEYNSGTANNDIAMMKLSRPLKLNKYVQPACFPSIDPPVGSKCYITGWGHTSDKGKMTQILQQGLLPVVSNKVCDEKSSYLHYITKTMICAGSGGTSRISGCQGDSGGPFVCNVNGKWELHGSVSFGSPFCRSDESYTVFSRTNYFKGWIKKMMSIY